MHSWVSPLPAWVYSQMIHYLLAQFASETIIKTTKWHKVKPKSKLYSWSSTVFPLVRIQEMFSCDISKLPTSICFPSSTYLPQAHSWGWCEGAAGIVCVSRCSCFKLQTIGWLVWWVVARLQKIAFEGMVVMVADVSVLNTIFAIMF